MELVKGQMDEGEPPDEYRDFVDGLVPFEEVQRQGETRSPFEDLAARVALAGVDLRFSFLTGAGLLIAAAALAALLPSEDTTKDGFWRLGRQLVSELLQVGNGLALPFALGALTLLVIAALAAPRNGEFARAVLVAQPFIGGAGVVGVGAMWAGFLALALVNLLVLLLIIVAYVVGTTLLLAFFVSLVFGMVGGR